jgi:hypothetical protein
MATRAASLCIFAGRVVVPAQLFTKVMLLFSEATQSAKECKCVSTPRTDELD